MTQEGARVVSKNPERVKAGLQRGPGNESETTSRSSPEPQKRHRHPARNVRHGSCLTMRYAEAVPNSIGFQLAMFAHRTSASRMLTPLFSPDKAPHSCLQRWPRPPRSAVAPGRARRHSIIRGLFTEAGLRPAIRRPRSRLVEPSRLPRRSGFDRVSGTGSSAHKTFCRAEAVCLGTGC